jgi:S-adenosylmethionine:tRNA ribosyltransferase-isomerase
VSRFSYELPAAAIATAPVEPRSASRLLVVPAEGTFEDRVFRELPALSGRYTALWVNATRVIRARLLLTKPTGGALEIFLLEPVGLAMEEALARTQSVTWTCLVRGARRWSSGAAHAEFTAPGGIPWQLTARLVGADVGTRSIAFTWEPLDSSASTCTWGEVLEAFGRVPLPPYMHREDTEDDRAAYQTVFATRPGSVAAPTAGLHFDDALWEEMRARLAVHQVTLHVGAGTFRPLDEDGPAAHTMHAEQCILDASTLAALAEAPDSGRLAVGTTTLRTLESAYWYLVEWHRTGKRPAEVPQWIATGEAAVHAEALGWGLRDAAAWAVRTAAPGEGLAFATSLMVVPGYRIRTIDGLVTNFHQPESTLLCLVEAVAGEVWREAYAHALRSGYRFLSYGDACLFEVRR